MVIFGKITDLDGIAMQFHRSTLHVQIIIKIRVDPTGFEPVASCCLEAFSFLKEKKIAMFKLPERLEVVTEFPAVGDSGKVNKETLKQQIKELIEKENR